MFLSFPLRIVSESLALNRVFAGLEWRGTLAAVPIGDRSMHDPGRSEQRMITPMRKRAARTVRLLCILFIRLTSTASHRCCCSSIRQSVRAIGHVDRFGPTHFACAHRSPPGPKRDHIHRRGRKTSWVRMRPLTASAIQPPTRVGCIGLSVEGFWLTRIGLFHVY